MVWDGHERRKNGARDHDLLIRIDSNLDGLVENFKEHIGEDKEFFHEHDKRLKSVERIIWCAIGMILFLEFIFKIIK